jgi:1-deoxy-D-xylulose-5-phosphate reductoisomerase
MIGVSILGSTGSIGLSTLDVLQRHTDRYRVVALTANRDVDGLAAQCRRFHPALAVMADPDCAGQLRRRLAPSLPDIEVLSGTHGLETAARLPEADYVMAAIVGAVGLLPALAAVRSGKRLLLANKEALVVSGGLFMREAEKHEAQILPIDSEHNAVFQCMPPEFSVGPEQLGVRRILLTASGGPFLHTPLEALSRVTPEDACAHPNWEMGRKISVDSATMMNKGLEVIEACWLFKTDPQHIQVVLHPQSVVHSMVEYTDGSILAQLGNPDMRTPIAHALAWPERMESGVQSLDLLAVARLDFHAPDLQRFPCLDLAYQAIRAGGTAPAILNAANEVAVGAFLAGRIGFTDIARTVETTLQAVASGPANDLAAILETDGRARAAAEQTIGALGR